MLRLFPAARRLAAVVSARSSVAAARRIHAASTRASSTAAASPPPPPTAPPSRPGWTVAAALIAAGAAMAWITPRRAEAEAAADSDAATAAASQPTQPQTRFRSAQPFSDPEHAGVTLLVASEVEDLVWKRNRPNAINSLPAEIRDVVRVQTPVTDCDDKPAAWSDTLANAASARASAAAPSAASNDAAAASPFSSAAASSLSAATPLFTPYSVLLDVYDPECGACATLKPVIAALAGALQSTPSVRVMTYDDESNRKAGFLSLQERSALPLLKFYPPLEYDGTDSPLSEEAKFGVVYTGDPNPLSLLRFIIAHTPPSFAFDAVAVERRLQAAAAETDAGVMQAVTNRLRNDRGFSLYEHSPCGPPMLDWMRMSIASRYSSVFDESAEAAEAAHGLGSPEGIAFKAFQTCMQSKEKDIREYWEQTLSVAQENLERYKDEAKNDDATAKTAAQLDDDSHKPKDSQWG